MPDLDSVLRTMTLEFFGGGKHKISLETLFETKNAVLLDVRSAPEQQSLDLRLEHDVTVLRIPTDEIPDRIDKIPRDSVVGVFCSGVTRASIVYAYLCTQGYTHVRIVAGGYEELMDAVKVGKLWQRLQAKPQP